MGNLKDIVVSKDLVVKLKEAGFSQNTVFWWNNQGLGHGHVGTFRLDVSEYPMPTAGELVAELPYNIFITKGSIWRVDFPYKNRNFTEKSIKLEDTLAKMWLCLKKEGVIK